MDSLRMFPREPRHYPVLLAIHSTMNSLAAKVLHRAELTAVDPFLEVEAGFMAAREGFFESVGSGWFDAEQGTLADAGAGDLPRALGSRILDRGKEGPQRMVFYCLTRHCCHTQVYKGSLLPCRAGWRRPIPGPCACPRCGSVAMTSPCWRPISCSANARWAAPAPVCSAGP